MPNNACGQHFPPLDPDAPFNEQFGRLQIGGYLTCGLCLAEKPDGVSQQEYKRLDVGFTREGLQVICLRHNCAVAHFALSARIE